jgi:hypothetical protein
MESILYSDDFGGPMQTQSQSHTLLRMLRRVPLWIVAAGH